MDISIVRMATYGERLEAALSTQLKVELAGRGMTQGELADAVGIEAATLSRYMQNKRPMPMPTFYKVAEALGITAHVLMQRTEARVQPEAQTA